MTSDLPIVSDFDDGGSGPTPEFALIFHGTTTGGMIITQHQIQALGRSKKPSLGAGSLFTLEQQEALRDILDGNLHQHDAAVLPSNTLINTTRTLCWFVKPRLAPMHFLLAGKRRRRCMVPWPTLVFLATKTGLSVAAIKGQGRPSAQTPLFHAPIMNVDEVGSVCLGSAHRPASGLPITKKMSAWEDAVYRTNFSHVNHTTSLKPTKKQREISTKDQMTFWLMLEKKETTRFPSSSLSPMGQTLGRWASQ